MSYLSRPSLRLGAALVAALVLVFAPAAALAQQLDAWHTTDDHYDAAMVQSHLDAARDALADRHGPLAEALFELHPALMVTPHAGLRRPTPPLVAPMRHRVEASHLVHHQAMNGGSLGSMHGSMSHPVGTRWFPHSMFAQDGRVFGMWGYARLLGAVAEHVERHSE